MNEIGRNDPCRCGSGAKYKRCCLSRRETVLREVTALEALVDDIGRWGREHERTAYDAAFADFCDGGLESFGLAGPGADELHEADLWLTYDVPLVDSQTLLARAADDAGADNMLRASLAASRIRVWRIVEDRGGGLIAASCAVTGVDATLDTIRPPWGDVAHGRLLVARSVEVAPRRFALLGRAPVVIGAVHDDFEGLLGRIESEFSDLARLWLEAGGRLAAAAWAWPEEREHTREGDMVADSHVSFDLPDVAAVIRALEGDPGFERTGDEFVDADVIAWRWRAATSAPSAQMPDEPGVQWFLCAEDCEAKPIEAKLELNLDYGSIWLFAPSPRRLERAERRFVAMFSTLLGDPIGSGTDRESVTRRWQRERWERTLTRLAPELRRARAMRAA